MQDGLRDEIELSPEDFISSVACSFSSVYFDMQRNETVN